MLNRVIHKRGPSDKSVFISYRRKQTWPLARSIREALHKHGYDVFLGVESIDNGTFDTIILQELAKRKHFIVILTLESVKRCIEPGDWVRREIETAMSLGCNIVPIMVDDFTFAAANAYLTGQLAELGRYNALRLVDDYFDAAINKLCSRFLKPGLNIPGAKRISSTHKSALVIPPPQPAPAKLSPEEYFSRGDLCTTNGDFDGAIRNYTHYLESVPNDALVFTKRGYAYRKKNDIDHALADYNAAIQLDPENPVFYNSRGDTYNTVNRYAEAIADYGQALHYDSNFTAAYYNRGLVYALTGAYKDAVLDYSSAIALSPYEAAAYFYRGMAYERSGLVKEALLDYEKALQLEPDYYLADRQRDVLLHHIHEQTRESPPVRKGP